MRVLILFLLLIFCIPLAWCQDHVQKSASMDQVLDPQRDFTLHDQDGKVFHLKDHRGHYSFVFWVYSMPG